MNNYVLMNEFFEKKCLKRVAKLTKKPTRSKFFCAIIVQRSVIEGKWSVLLLCNQLTKCNLRTSCGNPPGAGRREVNKFAGDNVILVNDLKR